MVAGWLYKGMNKLILFILGMSGTPSPTRTVGAVPESLPCLQGRWQKSLIFDGGVALDLRSIHLQVARSDGVVCVVDDAHIVPFCCKITP